jgi:hypothetical protein
MVVGSKKCPKSGLLKERFPHFKDFSTKIYLVIHGFYNSRFFPSPKKRELQGPPVYDLFNHNTVTKFLIEIAFVLDFLLSKRLWLYQKFWPLHFWTGILTSWVEMCFIGNGNIISQPKNFSEPKLIRYIMNTF